MQGGVFPRPGKQRDARRRSVRSWTRACSPSARRGGIFSRLGFPAAPCLRPGTSLPTPGSHRGHPESSRPAAARCRCPRVPPGSPALPSQLFEGSILSAEAQEGLARSAGEDPLARRRLSL